MTLIELTAVVFLISLIFTLAAPSFSHLLESRIKSDAKRLASVLRHLDETAVSSKKTLSADIDLDKRVLRYSTTQGQRTERFDSIRAVELQSKGRLSSGAVTVFFNPAGATEALWFYLNDGKKELTVSLNPLSGRVVVSE